MNYPLGPDNWVCRTFGHRYGKPYRSGGTVREVRTSGEVERRTCSLDGTTVPPFRLVRQAPPYDYLPDDQQPEGAR